MTHPLGEEHFYSIAKKTKKPTDQDEEVDD